jgi:hypothetical protein
MEHQERLEKLAIAHRLAQKAFDLLKCLVQLASHVQAEIH